MGYTHHWDRNGDIPDNIWEEIEYTIDWAIRNKPDYTDTAGGYDVDEQLEVEFQFSGDPGDRWLSVNGVGENSCENFILAQKDNYENPDDRPWPFCKTWRRPYDVLVVAALYIANHFAPDSVIPCWPGFVNAEDSESEPKDLESGLALGKLAVAAAKYYKSPFDIKFDVEPVTVGYNITIGEDGFAALHNYDDMSDGCQQSLESKIMQIEGITYAKVDYSDGPFEPDYNDCIGLTLYTCEATRENLCKVLRVIQNTLTEALEWCDLLREQVNG